MAHDPILRFYCQHSAGISAWQVRSSRFGHTNIVRERMQNSVLTLPDCLRESALLTAWICFSWLHRVPARSVE